MTGSAADGQGINLTIEKFGYPETLIADYPHWVVLLRPQQVTMGALILAAKGPSTAFSDLSADAFAEMHVVIQAIEKTLRAAFRPDKMNYLMLMMVDPHVHFHVLPRYAAPRTFEGTECLDPGWPGPPNLAAESHLTSSHTKSLTSYLSETWEAS